MATLSAKNNISIYAEGALQTADPTVSTGSQSYCFDDITWKATNESIGRYRGAMQGVAKSIEYNTGVRQSTIMSALLAEILLIRGKKSNDNGYANIDTNGIGTKYDGEENLQNHIINMSKIFDNRKFLFDSEVVTSKLDAKCVTTAKIADNAVTSGQLGSVVSSNTSSNNGITVGLSQDSAKGAIKITLTSTSVTKADTVKVAQIASGDTNEFYIGGWATSGAYPQYIEGKALAAAKMKGGTMTLSGGNLVLSKAGAYVQASSFYATSDVRKKREISTLTESDEKDIDTLINHTSIVNYKFKDSDIPEMGILAQSVEWFSLSNGFKLVKEGEDGYLRIEENKLVYLLWAYIQKLEMRVRQLEK